MSHRVAVTREGEHWLADVPELEGAHTFSRTLGGLERAVREVVVMAADLPDDAVDTVELEWDLRVGDPELPAVDGRGVTVTWRGDGNLDAGPPARHDQRP